MICPLRRRRISEVLEGDPAHRRDSLAQLCLGSRAVGPRWQLLGRAASADASLKWSLESDCGDPKHVEPPGSAGSCAASTAIP